MKHPYDTNIALCSVENACLKLKKEIADGSMLRGYTAKAKEDIDMDAVRKALESLTDAVSLLEEKVAE